MTLSGTTPQVTHGTPAIWQYLLALSAREPEMGHDAGG